MWNIVVAGAVMLATLAVAGLGSADDDCASGGFYRVCVFEDHAYTYSAGGGWGSYSYTQSSNTLASASASQGPSGSLSAYATQTDYDRTSCTTSCYHADTDATTIAVNHGSPASFGSVLVAQSHDEGTSEAGPSRREDTRVFAHRTVLGASTQVNFYQSSHRGPGYDQCSNTLIVGVVSYVTVPLGPCDVATPLGSVDTRAPQLADTCLDVGDAAPVCGTFPDYPDDTGLPFL